MAQYRYSKQLYRSWELRWKNWYWSPDPVGKKLIYLQVLQSGSQSLDRSETHSSSSLCSLWVPFMKKNLFSDWAMHQTPQTRATDLKAQMEVPITQRRQHADCCSSGLATCCSDLRDRNCSDASASWSRPYLEKPKMGQRGRKPNDRWNIRSTNSSLCLQVWLNAYLNGTAPISDHRNLFWQRAVLTTYPIGASFHHVPHELLKYVSAPWKHEIKAVQNKKGDQTGKVLINGNVTGWRLCPRQSLYQSRSIPV